MKDKDLTIDYYLVSFTHEENQYGFEIQCKTNLSLDDCDSLSALSVMIDDKLREFPTIEYSDLEIRKVSTPMKITKTIKLTPFEVAPVNIDVKTVAELESGGYVRQ